MSITCASGQRGTHGDPGKEFSEADAYRALDALMVVLDWYFKKERIGDIEELRREVNVEDSVVLEYRSRARTAGGFAAQCSTRGNTADSSRFHARDRAGLVHRWTGTGPPWPNPAATGRARLAGDDSGMVRERRRRRRDILTRRAPRWLVMVTSVNLMLFSSCWKRLRFRARVARLESRGLCSGAGGAVI